MKNNDYTPRNTHTKKVMPNSSQGSQKNTKLILALIKKRLHTTQKNKPSKMFAYHIVHTNFFSLTVDLDKSSKEAKNSHGKDI